MRLLLLLLLAGCTVPMEDQTLEMADNEPHHITNYAARPLHPLNCGTPYDFVICPLPVRVPIKTEPLFSTSITVQEIGGVPVDQTVATDEDE